MTGRAVERTVAIDCFPERAACYRDGHAIVAIDVIRATTTAITAVALGRRCYPVSTIEQAALLAARLPHSLLAGELGGHTPDGFAFGNSPAAVAERDDVARPMILLSTSGTRLICESGGAAAVYAACLRNVSAQVAHLADHHQRAALIGAGARGEFREEDQLCCAWIAEGLLRRGFVAENEKTERLIERWTGVSVERILESKSAVYLRDAGRLDDLEFILAHVDDLDCVFTYRENEIVAVTHP